MNSSSGRRNRALAPPVVGEAGFEPVLGLSWRDVDLDAGVIHLRQQMKRESGRPVLG